jgi:hypothetical protein
LVATVDLIIHFDLHGAPPLRLALLWLLNRFVRPRIAHPMRLVHLLGELRQRDLIYLRELRHGFGHELRLRLV